jgi:hypothetical protein
MSGRSCSAVRLGQLPTTERAYALASKRPAHLSAPLLAPACPNLRTPRRGLLRDDAACLITSRLERTSRGSFALFRHAANRAGCRVAQPLLRCIGGGAGVALAEPGVNQTELLGAVTSEIRSAGINVATDSGCEGPADRQHQDSHSSNILGAPGPAHPTINIIATCSGCQALCRALRSSLSTMT